MQFDDERWDTPEEPSQYTAPESRGTPMYAPKRRGNVCVAVLAVIAVALAAAIGIWQWAQRYELRLERGERGLSLQMDERAQADTSTAQAAPAQSDASAVTDAQPGAELVLQPIRQGVETPSSDEEDALSLQEIYEKMIPSVVSIITDAGTGTGIVMSADGYLITNEHVIADAQTITAMLYDEQSYTAALIGSDEASDLAVLKIEPDGALTAAEFGNSDALRVGDTVVAIGDPLGVKLRGTMTDGIISAINRDMLVNDRTMTLIQTNAALNSGNSGGPLINCYGQVIGVTAMKLSSYYSQATVEGLGFAIPINTAKPILEELIESGYVSGRPAIGISGERLPTAARVYYRLPDGVYVTYVNPASGAYAAGIREGDIITAINDTAVTSVDGLNAVKNTFSAGDTVTLTVYRSGQTATVVVELMDEALQ